MKIMIGIIDNGMGLSRTSWAFSMIHLCLSPVLRGHEITLQSVSFPYPCGAMNLITDNFLETDCSDLLIIDTDLIFRPEHVEWLLSHDVDVVAGLYPKKQLGLEFPMILPDGCGMEVFAEDPHAKGINPLVEVSAIARGFMRIKRHVLLRLSSLSMPVWRTQRGGHSEDFNFCETWRDCGGKIFVDQRIVLKHEGSAVYPIPGSY